MGAGSLVKAAALMGTLLLVGCQSASVDDPKGGLGVQHIHVYKFGMQDQTGRGENTFSRYDGEWGKIKRAGGRA
jgi:hypothetical protein